MKANIKVLHVWSGNLKSEPQLRQYTISKEYGEDGIKVEARWRDGGVLGLFRASSRFPRKVGGITRSTLFPSDMMDKPC